MSNLCYKALEKAQEYHKRTDSRNLHSKVAMREEKKEKKNFQLKR